MAVNKNAIVRYLVLNSCFSDFSRKYYFDDLLEKINEELQKLNPESSGIKVRQLRDDIRYMKSKEGYGAPIEAHREGKKAFYRYSKRTYNIDQSPINKMEEEQVLTTLSILERFEGNESFDQLNEIAPILKSQFSIIDPKNIISFGTESKLQGANMVNKVLNAIENKKVLNIAYSSYGNDEERFLFHPYYLKKFNNRWYVFGRNEKNFDNKHRLALDGITNCNEVNQNYHPITMDWDDYFENLIGVSQSLDPVQEIQLRANEIAAPKIIVNPIHSSQKIEPANNGYINVWLKVKPNRELESKILSYAEDVEVIFPLSLKTKIHSRLKKMLNL